MYTFFSTLLPLLLLLPCQARFTEFETAGLAKLLPAYASHDYFDQQLWDDVADSIAYCNHYLAPSRIPISDLAALFAAYAKYEVRGPGRLGGAEGMHKVGMQTRTKLQQRGRGRCSLPTRMQEKKRQSHMLASDQEPNAHPFCSHLQTLASLEWCQHQGVPAG